MGALALSCERQSAQMSEIKNGWLDQYGAECFKQQQSGTAGVEEVNPNAYQFQTTNMQHLPQTKSTNYFRTQ